MLRALLLVASATALAAGQIVISGGLQGTPYCGVYASCDPNDIVSGSTNYCCPGCGGGMWLSSTGSPNACICATGCAAEPTATTTAPAAWLSSVATSVVYLHLGDVQGTSVFGTSSVYLTASLVTSSQQQSHATSPATTGIFSTGALNYDVHWAAFQWAYLVLQMHDASSAQGVPIGAPVLYRIPAVSTTILMPAQFVKSSGTTFALNITLTVLPTDCGLAGVQDSDTCSALCAFAASHTSTAGANQISSAATYDGAGGCTCGTSGAANSYACAAPTTTTTASTTSSSSNLNSGSNGGSSGGSTGGSGGSSSRLAAGAEAGIVIGLVAFLAFVGVMVYRYKFAGRHHRMVSVSTA
jgi:uncharacterized membrane protein YgcG